MHASTLTILSGASRGLGLSLARQALAAGHQLITLARSELQLDAPPGRTSIYKWTWPARKAHNRLPRLCRP